MQWINLSYHDGAGAQGLGPSSIAFPGHLQGVESQLEQLRHESVPLWDANATGRALVYYATVPTLPLCLFKDGMHLMADFRV